MSNLDFPFPSNVVNDKDLKIARAKEVALAIRMGYLSYVQLVECRVLDNGGLEGVIFDVEVELGQKNNIYDIKKHERIAVIFDPQDELFPEVISLRQDFPRVPHTNLRDHTHPVSLCLYDQPYSEVKLFLTPTRFIERIRQWLADTTKGRLHGEDQPLEPLFLEFGNQLIIPFDLFNNFSIDNPPVLDVHGTKVNDKYTFIAEHQGIREPNKKIECVAVVLQCPPQAHGVIHKKPVNLNQLHEFTSQAGLDLLSILRTILQKWQGQDNFSSLQDLLFMLIIAFPKTRSKNDKIEATDIWGFLLADTVKKVGVEIGVWEIKNNFVARLLSIDQANKGEKLSIEMCKTMFSFSRELAAKQNGLVYSDQKRIVMIGAGALGSQIFMNLTRAGYGEWTVIDHDILLPHNLARHALNSYAIGFSKSNYLAWMANEMINGAPIAKGIIKDILKPRDYDDDLRAALANANVILDCTASIAATRHITRDIASSSRRLSVFLNPAGTDSVLLAEDSKREIPLDHVEMQYYRLVIDEKDLGGHLVKSGQQFRYANSCSDINSALSQEMVALHSAIGSAAFRNINSSDSARIMVWRINPSDLSVRNYSFNPIEMIQIKSGEWTIYTDEWLIEKIYKARAKKLPNETGGILIGSFDMQRRIIYIIDTLLSPPDSKEWPTVYIRGCQGLAQKMKEISNATLGRLEYMGEWHSHPKGSSCLPSQTDKQAFILLADMRRPDGLPAIMLIAGDKKQYGIYLGQMI